MVLLCNYYVTLKCNSRCTYCDIWKKKEHYKLKEQSLKTVENNLKNLKRLGVKIIDFTGGEPLLYPNLINALKLAKKLGFFTTITTNCLLYPKYANELKGLVDLLFFSIASSNKNLHNKIRGIKGFDKVIESIRLSKLIKQKIILIHTVTNDNVKNLKSMIKFAQDNNCLISIGPCFEYFGNEAASKQTIQKIKDFSNEPYVLIDKGYLKFIIRGGNDLKNPTCKALSSTIVISPDNYLILPCYHHSIKKIKIRNNLYELYNSEEVKKIKKMEGKYLFCKNCTIYCYMRTSLYTKYLFDSLQLWLKYLIESNIRKQF